MFEHKKPKSHRARRLIAAVVLTWALLCGLPVADSSAVVRRVAAAPAAAQLNWYRGNTHTHTNNSDGDSPPLSVAARYRELGYNFLFITDHNRLTDVETLNAQLGVPGQFLVIRGEEVTDSFAGRPVHINALNNSSVVTPQGGIDVRGTIDNDAAAIRRAGGVPYIAHPNYQFALNAEDLKGATGATLFEVYNAHPVVNNDGDETHSSVETKWDEALSSGRLLYGLAADDMHNLYRAGGALPGQGWIMVRAASLDAGSITRAIEGGDFYASNGVTLRDYQLGADSVTVTVDDALSGPCIIDFIGRNGSVLQRSTSSPAVYHFTGEEMYVRAKVTNTQGKSAWTQPVYTARLNASDGVVNGASLGNGPESARAVAPDSVAVVAGLGLAGLTQQAQRQPDGTFPTEIGGTTVTVNGRAAQLYYVSPSQVNFRVPSETEVGGATVVLKNADGMELRGQVRVADSAPGVFTVDGTGRGDAFYVDMNTLYCSFFMPDDGARRLQLYATGVRRADSVEVTINGQAVTVEAVKACRGLPGLDQINIAVPPNVLPNGGSGVLSVNADGQSSNPVMLRL